MDNDIIFDKDYKIIMEAYHREMFMLMALRRKHKQTKYYRREWFHRMFEEANDKLESRLQRLETTKTV